MMQPSVVYRFWAKVAISPTPDGCWEWLGSYRKDSGHGTFSYQSVSIAASRMAWILTYGDPGAHLVCHTCDNSRCVRVGHLYLGTLQTNGRDKAVRARHRSNFWKTPGERCAFIQRCKDLRLENTTREVAAILGCSIAVVQRILNGRCH